MHKFDKRNKSRTTRVGQAPVVKPRVLGKLPALGAPYGETQRRVITEDPDDLKLVCCAIVRDGMTHSGAAKSHAMIRGSLDDADPYVSRSGDLEGFLTSDGRFLTRAEAVPVAVRAGQLSEQWLTVNRPLLSSDLNW